MASVIDIRDYQIGVRPDGYACGKRSCKRLGDVIRVTAQSSLGGLVRVFLCDRCADELKPRESAAQGVMFKES